MDEDDTIYSPSYFWKCLTLSEDCPFFLDIDPKLRYFGIGLTLLYGAFLLMILWDLGFYWSIDNLHHQVDHYINLVSNKVKHVQKDQRRLMSTRERTEKQLRRSNAAKNVVTGLRAAIQSSDMKQFAALTNFHTLSAADDSEWSRVENVVNY